MGSLRKHCPMILGISPGNPHYYKEENLKKLFQFADNNADEVKLFIPDIISEHNYRAVGSNNPERAARVKANRLRNKIKGVFKTAYVDQEKFTLIDWNAEVETAEQYQNILDDITILYNTNEAFHNDVAETTQMALVSLMSGRGKEEFKDIDTDEGALYLLKELAFFAAVPEIYPQLSNYNFVYHADWPVLINFFEGKYDGICRRCLGLIIFK